MFKPIYLFLLITIFGFQSDKVYIKNYFENRRMKCEGWSQNDKKINYWFFYHENGSKREEGHFENNRKVKWWVYYDTSERIVRKCQFKNDAMDGLCILYKNGNIMGAERYSKGKKIKEWKTISEFKKDNDISMLND
jgi:antitoxin component YwqK of YwqJK toxin-antitoxin module